MTDIPDDDALLVVDIDGTLCDIKATHESYADVRPRMEMIARLREYQQRGYRILLYTSRNMKTHNHNLGLINKHTAPVLLAWLDKWEVPYDEILFGKPWPRKRGFYVDDRAIRPDEFLKLSEQEIHAMLGQE
ncbi:capsular biosynthesis protein [Pseudoduganella chitinolytica]|uniref:Capsular biosynthesis protein n=1 Tax=Pseudoduganella chitinolytica TaxID=34070 RepID=A0ABY8BDZ6_9BURK|nr:capsular biosynthesis protein [Pseudoduganella chitinolytica]WEF32947.1 capsular biosynthesis protein [Pseudoduganella chitinolytica]